MICSNYNTIRKGVIQMVTFLIVRHGYSMGNKEKRFSGQMDVALDEIGLRQARSIAEYVLANFQIDVVYASDLRRAVDTVKPVAEQLHLPVKTSKSLREVDVGDWQGKLITDVEREYPESFALYKENPGLSHFDGGESYAELQQRVVRAFEKIAADNDGKTVLVGTHGGVIRTLRAAWTGTPLEKIKDIAHVPNASVTVAVYENGRFTLENVGYCDYLSDKTTEEGVK